MEMHLDRAHMLEAWKLHRTFNPVRDDAEITRTDGVDLDDLLSAEMDLWYGNLLLTAPESLLVPHDLSPDVPIPLPEKGSTVLRLPDDVVRVLEIKLSSWVVPARIVTADTSVAAKQLSLFTRATVDSPVAVRAGGRLMLYPHALPGDSFDSFRCVVHTPDRYDFMHEALASITD